MRFGIALPTYPAGATVEGMRQNSNLGLPG